MEGASPGPNGDLRPTAAGGSQTAGGQGEAHASTGLKKGGSKLTGGDGGSPGGGGGGGYYGGGGGSYSKDYHHGGGGGGSGYVKQGFPVLSGTTDAARGSVRTAPQTSHKYYKTTYAVGGAANSGKGTNGGIWVECANGVTKGFGYTGSSQTLKGTDVVG